MPKIYDNGAYREMTAEEIAEHERLIASHPDPEMTQEEIIAAQGQEIAQLKEALEMLLSGVTEDG